MLRPPIQWTWITFHHEAHDSVNSVVILLWCNVITYYNARGLTTWSERWPPALGSKTRCWLARMYIHNSQCWHLLFLYIFLFCLISTILHSHNSHKYPLQISQTTSRLHIISYLPVFHSYLAANTPLLWLCVVIFLAFLEPAGKTPVHHLPHALPV